MDVMVKVPNSFGYAVNVLLMSLRVYIDLILTSFELTPFRSVAHSFDPYETPQHLYPHLGFFIFYYSCFFSMLFLILT